MKESETLFLSLDTSICYSYIYNQIQHNTYRMVQDTSLLNQYSIKTQLYLWTIVSVRLSEILIVESHHSLLNEISCIHLKEVEQF